MENNVIYLESYVESTNSLPPELQRVIQTIKTLDERAQDLSRDLQQNVERCLSLPSAQQQGDEQLMLLHPQQQQQVKRDGTDKVSSLRNLITEQQRLLVQYAEEKVQLAIQGYDLLDMHAQRLARDLGVFELDLQSQGLLQDSLGVAHDSSLFPSLMPEDSLPPPPPRARSTAPPPRASSRQGPAPSGGAAAQPMDLEGSGLATSAGGGPTSSAAAAAAAAAAGAATAASTRKADDGIDRSRGRAGEGTMQFISSPQQQLQQQQQQAAATAGPAAAAVPTAAAVAEPALLQRPMYKASSSQKGPRAPDPSAAMVPQAAPVPVPMQVQVQQQQQPLMAPAPAMPTPVAVPVAGPPATGSGLKKKAPRQPRGGGSIGVPAGLSAAPGTGAVASALGEVAGVAEQQQQQAAVTAAAAAAPVALPPLQGIGFSSPLNGLQFSAEAPQAPGRLLTVADVTQALIGRQAELFWPDDNLWYLIEIQSVDVATRQAQILYTTGESELLNLDEIIREGHMSLITR